MGIGGRSFLGAAGAAGAAGCSTSSAVSKKVVPPCRATSETLTPFFRIRPELSGGW